MTKSSRARAYTWPYPLYRKYEEALRQAAKFWFRSKGFTVSKIYSFILTDREDWSKNIILPEVVDYIESDRTQREARQQSLPLHKYIRHGRSSQAMLFNLIGPLIVRDDPKQLRNAIDEQGIYWPMGKTSASFEYEDREVFNEYSSQHTSIDLVIQDSSDKPCFFVEAILVEKEFGGCSIFPAGDVDE